MGEKKNQASEQAEVVLPVVGSVVVHKHVLLCYDKTALLWITTKWLPQKALENNY